MPRQTRQQRDAGDCAARLSTVDAGESGERRLVEPHRHADADDEPTGKQHPRSLRRAESRKTRSENQTRDRQYVAAAEKIDAAAGKRPENRGDDKRGRERREDNSGRYAKLARHRHRQDCGQVVG